MAYDSERGGAPRGPWRPGCKQPVKEGQPSTRMHFRNDPDGSKGLSGMWHGECARPYWDTITPVLNKLKSIGF